ncbi:MAG TPA: type II toxin-antitoxin system RelE/ParE family toxin [Roseomonas sp.]
MKVAWTFEAEQDRTAIWDAIAADNPAAADRVLQAFRDAAAKLADFPRLGRVGKIPDTRELFPHGSYRLMYRVMADMVVVLALVHTARQWPPPRA